VIRDRADVACPVNPVEEPLLGSVERHDEISAGVRSVDQHGRGARRQMFVHTDRVRHPNGHVMPPGLVVKANALRIVNVVLAVRDQAVARHRAAKELDGGVLRRHRQRAQASGLRELRHHAAARTVGRLPDPPSERQACPLDEFEDLRN
jgi:hypothetical protein